MPGQHAHGGPPPPGDQPPDTTSSGRSVLRHLTGGIVGLALTPVAIVLLTYGGYRYQDLASTGEFGQDTRGLAALGAGAFVLLLVACSGALSASGPILGGLVWGLVPAGVYLVIPEDVVDWVWDFPVVPAATESGTVIWLAVGSFLAVGVTLFGSGLGVAMRRR